MKTRRGKRIFAVLVTVLLVIAAIPTAGFAQGDTIAPTPTVEDSSEPVPTTTEQAPTPSSTPAATTTEPTENTVSDTSDFTIDENGVITAYTGAGGDVVIPETINGIIVKEIAFYSFEGSNNLKEITSISIPATITNIWDRLIGASNLQSFNVDENNPNYASENGVLYSKDKTHLYRYPTGKTDKKYAIPENVTSLDDSAFEGNAYLESISIPNGVDTIPAMTFSSCTSLVSVEMPNRLTAMGAAAFENCVSLTNIIIPEGIERLSLGVFSGCTSLAEVKFPTTLKSMSEVFSGCTSLKEITLRENLEELSGGTFYGCSALSKVVFQGNAPILYEEDVKIFENCSSNLKLYYTSMATGFTTPTWNGYSCYPLEEEKPEPTPTPTPTPDKPTTEPEENDLKISSLSEEQQVIAEEKILAVLKIDKLAEDSSIQYYDIKLINAETGEAYTEDNFPKEGVDVLLPYPEGMNKTSHTFRLFHFAEGIEGNPVEVKITLADKGIKFHADSLSPFALVSTEVEGTKNPVETSETTPKTGDSGLPIWIPVLMMAAASVTIMLLLYKRKAHRA